MSRTAKVFMTNRSQAVRLPREYADADHDDRSLHAQGGRRVIVSPRARDWRTYFETAPAASDTFMLDVEDLPVQERES